MRLVLFGAMIAANVMVQILKHPVGWSGSAVLALDPLSGHVGVSGPWCWGGPSPFVRAPDLMRPPSAVFVVSLIGVGVVLASWHSVAQVAVPSWSCLGWTIVAEGMMSAASGAPTAPPPPTRCARRPVRPPGRRRLPPWRWRPTPTCRPTAAGHGGVCLGAPSSEWPSPASASAAAPHGPETARQPTRPSTAAAPAPHIAWDRTRVPTESGAFVMRALRRAHELLSPVDTHDDTEQHRRSGP